MKLIQVTKIVKEITFEGVRSELGEKFFPETTTQKVSETGSDFYVK